MILRRTGSPKISTIYTTEVDDDIDDVNLKSGLSHHGRLCSFVCVYASHAHTHHTPNMQHISFECMDTCHYNHNRATSYHICSEYPLGNYLAGSYAPPRSAMLRHHILDIGTIVQPWTCLEAFEAVVILIISHAVNHYVNQVVLGAVGPAAWFVESPSLVSPLSAAVVWSGLLVWVRCRRGINAATDGRRTSDTVVLADGNRWDITINVDTRVRANRVQESASLRRH